MMCPDENELVLLADGALTESRRASIDRHLDGCASCTVLVAELAGMAAPERPVPARYKVIRQLGAGAMGVVWEAEDKHLGRRVALKFVRTRATDAADTRADTRERRKRLVREARALAQLHHPNVVNVYDVGESNEELFLALELVIGTDARTWRAVQPRSIAEILDVWRQAVAGVAAVHRAGIVHRDIKPDNILVADDGRVLVGDFGLATDDGPGSRHAHDHLTANAPLTQTGALVGTPMYMAYELLLGDPATQKSDQYALCASIWEALAGDRPFAGPTLAALADAMQARPAIPAIPAATAHRALFVALARGLDPNPARRWPSVDALLAALDTRPSRRRPRLRPALLATTTATIAALATVGVLAWRGDDTPRAPAAVLEQRAAPVEGDKRAGEQRVAPVADDERAGEQRAAPVADDKRAGEQRAAPVADDMRAGEQRAAPGAGDKRAGEQRAAPVADDKREGEQRAAPVADDKRAGEQRAAPVADDKREGEQGAAPVADDEHTMPASRTNKRGSQRRGEP